MVTIMGQTFIFGESLNGMKRSIYDHRQQLAQLVNNTIPVSEGVVRTDVLFGLDSDRSVKITARVYRTPELNTAQQLPTIIYFPGTAFVAYELTYTDAICSQLCKQTNSQVILIHHRLAPETQFPTSLNDMKEVTEYILSESAQFKIDRANVVLSGYSSGGNFAAAVGIHLKNKGIKVSYQLLMSPYLDLARRSSQGFESEESKDTAVSHGFLVWSASLYLPANVKPEDPDASPIWHANLYGLPPTVIHVGGFDRLLGDAKNFSRKLKVQRVASLLKVHAGRNHGYLWQDMSGISEVAAQFRGLLGRYGVPFAPVSQTSISTQSFFSLPSPSGAEGDENGEKNQKGRVSEPPRAKL